ncbi:uncharacterized protein SAPINGB_P002361 [Magnusiomyces paraingens]|uniref:Uncharacterized protein n=1 Tax=Magnusiomyces paraingens TaxID=2606893 RepID=A0A5E8BDF5_9ASCO|nr:uncharacterized protein SAPINGB_P002361 [Saprochaete ingens]VVT49623.1 unnamed protein product [Saprochaete ingens]
MTRLNPKRRHIILLIASFLDISTLALFIINAINSPNFFHIFAMYQIAAPQLSTEDYLSFFINDEAYNRTRYSSKIEKLLPSSAETVPAFDFYYNENFCSYNSTKTDDIRQHYFPNNTVVSNRSIKESICYLFLRGYIPREQWIGFEEALDYESWYVRNYLYLSDCTNTPLEDLSQGSIIGIILWSISISLELLFIIFLYCASGGEDVSVRMCIVCSWTFGLMLLSMDAGALLSYANYVDKLVQYLTKDYGNLVILFREAGLNPATLPRPITLGSRILIFSPLIPGVLRFGIWQVGVYAVWMSKDSPTSNMTWYETLEKKILGQRPEAEGLLAGEDADPIWDEIGYNIR